MSKIQRLAAVSPRGSALTTEYLRQNGISPQLAAKYVRSGWLTRLGPGYYSLIGDEVDVLGALRPLQDKYSGFHIAGKTALSWFGRSLNIYKTETIHVWADEKRIIPSWMATAFPIVYSSSKLFTFIDPSLDSLTRPVCNTRPFGLFCSLPERSILEILSEVGTSNADTEEVRGIFDFFIRPNVDLLGRLLAVCRSQKVIRLFAKWAEETGCVDVRALYGSYNIKCTSEATWTLKDSVGHHIRLKPVHGDLENASECLRSATETPRRGRARGFRKPGVRP